MTGFHATPEVLKAMLEKANEMLSSSKRDLEVASFGDAASRAYYAAFHAVSAVLASKGMTFSSHSQTLGAFNRDFVKTQIFSPETAKKLQRLFEDRQIADYEWRRHVDEETGVEDVANAEWLVNACAKHLENLISTD